MQVPMFFHYMMATGIYVVDPGCIRMDYTQVSALEPKKEEEQLRDSNDSSNLVVNVTVQDLQKAGYNSNKTPWTEEEDAKLKKLRDQEELQWADIAYKIPGRNSKMCYSRYRRLQNHTKEIWKKADDQLLIQLVQKHGENWKEIKRTHKQIKEHYINYLRPEIKRDDWTLEEDYLLVQLLNQHGKNWKAIENVLVNRTQNQIKNRYFGRLKRISDKKLPQKERSQRDFNSNENI